MSTKPYTIMDYSLNIKIGKNAVCRLISLHNYIISDIIFSNHHRKNMYHYHLIIKTNAITDLILTQAAAVAN